MRCEFIVTRPRYAKVGTPERHLPAIEAKHGVPATVTMIRPAGYGGNAEWREVVKHFCEECATRQERAGVTGFVRVALCDHCESDEHLAEDCLNGECCLGKCNV